MLAPSLGSIAADWIEQWCVHGPGDVQGQPVKLTNEALEFLYDAYELEPVTGRRRYKRAMLIRPKGWSKSEVAAFVALFEAFGPARFGGWDENGEPMGRMVQTPVIRIIATEENQAGNIFDVAYYNCISGPLNQLGPDAGLTRINLPGGGNIRPVSAGAASKDGGKETFVCFDEIHLFILPELHRLHQTYLRNLRKRTGSDPWSLETSTVHRPGEGSVAETAMEYARKIQAKEALDAGLLYADNQPDPSLDMNDPAQRMLALKQAYGDCTWVDFEQIVKDWDDPTTDKIDWQRYYANRVVVSADTYIDPAEWAELADATKSLHDNDQITIGIDTSLVDDGTAIVACRISDGFISRLGYWQKPEGRAGIDWQVPYGEVDAIVRQAFDQYRVIRLYCDPQYAHSLLSAWSLQYGEKRIYAWHTNRAIAMAAALERFYVAVKTQQGLSHDGDTLLARHVGNARTWMSQGRTLVRKEHHRSPQKIDALIAAVLCYEAAADAHEAGEDIEPAPVSRRVWSF